MCGHSLSAEMIIQQLIHTLYPAIQHQLVIIDSIGCSINKQESKLCEIIVGLKNEFQSLVTYENKLVFSSVLKVFNSQLEDANILPNIKELVQLTANKEQRILAIVDELEQELNNASIENKEPFNQLIHLFKKDFVNHKTDWSNMIANWFSSCACFQLISQQFNP